MIDDPRYLLAMATSGELVRTARLRAGMTQAQLAERSGLTQSVVSDYERDRRSPALTTLQRLVAATGYELQIGISDLARTGLEGVLARRLHALREEVVARAAAHGATNVRVFGSVARGEERATSDVDLLVDLAPGTGLVQLLTLRDELADLLGASVDVVPADSLKPRMADAVLADVRPL